MKTELEQAVAAAVKDLFDVETTIDLSRPEEQFGDYATNVALQLSKQVGQNPREIGEALATKLRDTLAEQVSDVNVAGPGFVNLKLSDSALSQGLQVEPQRRYQDQEVLVEFGDPNPFKEMHIGHLYSYVVGDAIASLLEAAGAQVRRLSYHGDVGLHVAKAIWGLQQDPAAAIGTAYAKGATAYEADETAHQQIDNFNQQVYAQDPSIRELYEQGKTRSFADFDQMLQKLGIKNDQRYLESEAAPVGIEMVRRNIGQVFTESDGAIIYEGEKVGLHTRVFITSKGLPTYEAKDLGLTELKNRDYPQAARSIIITANEQAEYFKVMLAALGEISPAVRDKTTHLTHGFVSLSSGKMSSRTGEVFSAANLMTDVEQATEKLHPGSPQATKLGAIKYAFVKHRLGGDLVYDVEESVALEGNSGPYLQYAHARARSILQKVDAPRHSELGSEVHTAASGVLKQVQDDGLQADERSLVRKLTEYPEVVDRAVNELMPHHIAGYLYELAQVFNRFYEKNRVIGDARESLRLGLVSHYADTLRNGLQLLGIAAPDKM